MVQPPNGQKRAETGRNGQKRAENGRNGQSAQCTHGMARLVAQVYEHGPSDSDARALTHELPIFY